MLADTEATALARDALIRSGHRANFAFRPPSGVRVPEACELLPWPSLATSSVATVRATTASYISTGSGVLLQRQLQPQAQPQAQLRPQAQSQAQSQSQLQAQSQLQPHPRPQPQPHPQPQGQSQPRPQIPQQLQQLHDQAMLREREDRKVFTEEERMEEPQRDLEHPQHECELEELNPGKVGLNSDGESQAMEEAYAEQRIELNSDGETRLLEESDAEHELHKRKKKHKKKKKKRKKHKKRRKEAKDKEHEEQRVREAVRATLAIMITKVVRRASYTPAVRKPPKARVPTRDPTAPKRAWTNSRILQTSHASVAGVSGFGFSPPS